MVRGSVSFGQLRCCWCVLAGICSVEKKNRAINGLIETKLPQLFFHRSRALSNSLNLQLEPCNIHFDPGETIRVPTVAKTHIRQVRPVFTIPNTQPLSTNTSHSGNPPLANHASSTRATSSSSTPNSTSLSTALSLERKAPHIPTHPNPQPPTSTSDPHSHTPHPSPQKKNARNNAHHPSPPPPPTLFNININTQPLRTPPHNLHLHHLKPHTPIHPPSRTPRNPQCPPGRSREPRRHDGRAGGVYAWIRRVVGRRVYGG